MLFLLIGLAGWPVETAQAYRVPNRRRGGALDARVQDPDLSELKGSLL
ncbi:hypothetical protein [Zemynaea arenosa]|nr:hypothetical protein [Massilia arenosa]